MRVGQSRFQGWACRIASVAWAGSNCAGSKSGGAHSSIEVCSGWAGSASDAAGVIYQPPSDDDFGRRPVKDERTAALSAVLSRVGAKMRWDYDFGDGWEHDVVVEAIEPAATDVVYPRCTAGRRACPPEDCGGPWDYTNLLEVDVQHSDTRAEDRGALQSN